jgi:hypothetical protein
MMKKVCMLLIFVSVFLFGCSNEKKDLKENPGLDKSEKIEVSSEENPELVLSVIDNQDEVNEFVNTLEINKWRIVDTPSTSTFCAVLTHLDRSKLNRVAYPLLSLNLFFQCPLLSS